MLGDSVINPAPKPGDGARQIYMNYASTHPFKSERLIRGLAGYLEQNRHLSDGRNLEGLDEGRISLRARLALARLFGDSGEASLNPLSVILAGGLTLSLNMVFGGFLKEGDHVLSTGVEHNAVSRPLELLRRKNIIGVDFLPCGRDGAFDPSLIAKNVRPNTRLFVMTHGSNALGTLLPAAECFAQAKRFGLFTVLDAAQTAGFIPVKLSADTDVIAFTGHKALGALQGTGGFVLNAGAASRIEPWIAGGTGSASDSLLQPDFLPDKYESGTANVLGALSLAIAVEELLEKDMAHNRRRLESLRDRFIAGLKTIKGLAIHGTEDSKKSLPIVPVSFPLLGPGLLARELFEKFSVITRPGLHCAPLAHQCAGTFPQGTVRFSFGPETTDADIDAALLALEGVLQGAKRC
jgi:selenocysteine lyase/cysteine desulfurase